MGFCLSLVQFLAVYDFIPLHPVKTVFFQPGWCPQQRRRVKRKCLHCKMSKITLSYKAFCLALLWSASCFTLKNTNLARHPKLDTGCKMSSVFESEPRAWSKLWGFMQYITQWNCLFPSPFQLERTLGQSDKATLGGFPLYGACLFNYL